VCVCVCLLLLMLSCPLNQRCECYRDMDKGTKEEKKKKKGYQCCKKCWYQAGLDVQQGWEGREIPCFNSQAKLVRYVAQEERKRCAREEYG
jgi:hypothetical protein